MTSQGFSFPPPPPPPPSTSTQQPAAYSPAHVGPQWNSRGSGGRGRGRGHGNRGRGGGHHGADKNRPTPYANPPGYNFPQGGYGYPGQTHPVPTTSYMTPNPTATPSYPHSAPNYQHAQPPHSYQHPPNYTQPAASTGYPGLPGYSHPPPTNQAHPISYNTQTPQPYPPTLPPPPQNHLASNAVMGAPWGGPSLPQQGRGGWGSHTSHAHGGHHISKPRHHHNNKRDHTTAFNKPQNTVPRTPAPPAVPSFGNPLPSKPPPVADTPRKNKKRKRKHNQLGLTPKNDDHESSEEEEEVDEEAKLAQSGADAAAPLQFTYRGQTATLQSQTDIAAWIAERKKKFPTQARIEERKKAAEEAKATRDAARLEKQKEREKEREKQKPKQQGKTPVPAGGSIATAGSDPALDAAMKAQRKAEKIKRNLDREQKRFAKAEAEAEAARLKVEALQRQAQGLNPQAAAQDRDAPASTAQPSTVLADEGTSSTATLTDLPKAAETPGNAVTVYPEQDAVSVPHTSADAVSDQARPILDLDSAPSEVSDWTSSSGSDVDTDSGSDSDSDSDSDGSAPEEVTSRRQAPERVPAPPREGKKTVCRHFARTGRCKMGDRCKFSHEVSERAPKAKPKPAEKDKKERKGLLQAVSCVLFFFCLPYDQITAAGPGWTFYVGFLRQDQGG